MVIGLAKSTVRRDLDGQIAEVEKRLADSLAKQIDSLPKAQDGKDGESVSIDQAKELAEAWLADNVKVKDGTDGTNGKDGLDALQINILPMIDETKTYAKGTYAQHDGGVMKASRNTDPIQNVEPLTITVLR